MSFLSLLYPFGRIGRLRYLVTALACLAIGWAGLNVIRFGGEYWRLGLFLFWPALYLLFAAMVNRTRDADASAGWVLFPILVTIAAVAVAVNIGPINLAAGLPDQTALDRIGTWPARVLLVAPSVLLPLMVGGAVSLFFWALSLVALWALPSRPPRK